jgi:hypothetical protein
MYQEYPNTDLYDVSEKRTKAPRDILLSGNLGDRTPLRLALIYKEDESHWGFIYQTMEGGQYFHAKERKEEGCEDEGFTRIFTKVDLVQEGDLIYYFMAMGGVWADEIFVDWPAISWKARCIVRKLQ